MRAAGMRGKTYVGQVCSWTVGWRGRQIFLVPSGRFPQPCGGFRRQRQQLVGPRQRLLLGSFIGLGGLFSALTSTLPRSLLTLTSGWPGKRT